MMENLDYLGKMVYLENQELTGQQVFDRHEQTTSLVF